MRALPWSITVGQTFYKVIHKDEIMKDLQFKTNLKVHGLTKYANCKIYMCYKKIVKTDFLFKL